MQKSATDFNVGDLVITKNLQVVNKPEVQNIQ